MAVATRADAATKVWTGNGGNVNWSTGANWQGGTAPAAGDTLQFPDGAAQLLSNNDFAIGRDVGGIQFTGTVGNYTVSGNGIHVAGGAISSASTSGANTVSLDIDLTGTLTLDAPSAQLFMTGSLSGTGSISTTGTGVLLGGASTYTGQTSVSSGMLVVSNNLGLGAGDGTVGTGTIVSNGATLAFANVTIASEYIAISGPGLGSNGAIETAAGKSPVLNGPIVLSSDATISAPALTTLTLNGPITGSGKLFIGGGGIVLISNTSTSIPSGIALKSGSNATLRLGASVSLATPMDVPAGCTFDLSGFNTTLTALTNNGLVTLGNGILAVTGSSTFAGTVSSAGIGKLQVQGGTFTMAGLLSYPGSTNVIAGTLLLDGSSTSAIAGNIGSTIGGTGNAAAGISGTSGTVAPGHSPGILSSGNLNLDSSIYAPELNGATVGSGYDQINVTGSVLLNGNATLNASLGFVPPPGAQFTIINNDGGEAVTGTFAGLAEGAALSIGGQPFTISYVGGSGNDVVLTAGAGVPTTDETLLLVLAALAFAVLARRLVHRTAPLS